MNQKKDIAKRLRYCVLICESLYSDYDSTSPFAEVGNYAAIDYTLNWLSQSGFEEVFLFYSTLKNQIQEYHQKFAKSFDIKMRLNYMKSSELKSFGDIIREVQFRDLVSEDFLVMYADTLSNIDLSLVIQNHFQKKIELKNVVLTTAMRRAHSPHLMVLNSNTSQILQIQQNGKQFSLNVEKVNLKKLNVEFRQDLVPADLFICTIEVLKSFKETQQYLTMHDFIVGMLTSQVYQQKIIAYQLKSKDIFLRINRASTTYLTHMNYVCGYLFPYSPYSQDRLSKIPKGGDKLLTVGKYHKIYRRGTKVADSVQLSNNVSIGQNSRIEAESLIEKSIIGKNSVVGKNSVLKYCVVLDDVKLAEHSHFQYCLLQKVSDTLKIHNFRAEMFEEPTSLIQREIFESTPEAEVITFQDELRHLLVDKPEQETILVSQLVRIRKQFQKSQGEFTRQVVRILAPKGVKGIQSVTDQWGSVLFKVHHEEESQLIESLYFACTGIEDYLKAFHLFLQYFYHYEVLTKQGIIDWLKHALADNPTQTLKLCAPFLDKLEVESEQQQSGEEES